MTWLLIGFIIFLALAPLSHFIPTKAQRRQARLREHAALAGLFVEFRKLPGSDDRLRPSPPGTIFYGRRVLDRKRSLARVTLVRDAEGWRPPPGAPRDSIAAEVLALLPATVMAIETSADALGIYWTEAGEESDVDAISDVLQRLLDDAKPRAIR